MKGYLYAVLLLILNGRNFNSLAEETPSTRGFASLIADFLRGDEQILKDVPMLESIPDSTSFTCESKIPGFYADLEYKCQVFYFCTPEGDKHAFLCSNGTIFNQQFMTCDWWFKSNCDQSANFFHLNENLYVEKENIQDEETQNIPKKNENEQVIDPVLSLFMQATPSSKRGRSFHDQQSGTGGSFIGIDTNGGSKDQEYNPSEGILSGRLDDLNQQERDINKRLDELDRREDELLREQIDSLDRREEGLRYRGTDEYAPPPAPPKYDHERNIDGYEGLRYRGTDEYAPPPAPPTKYDHERNIDEYEGLRGGIDEYGNSGGRLRGGIDEYGNSGGRLRGGVDEYGNSGGGIDEYGTSGGGINEYGTSGGGLRGEVDEYGNSGGGIDEYGNSGRGIDEYGTSGGGLRGFEEYSNSGGGIDEYGTSGGGLRGRVDEYGPN